MLAWTGLYEKKKNHYILPIYFKWKPDSLGSQEQAGHRIKFKFYHFLEKSVDDLHQDAEVLNPENVVISCKYVLEIYLNLEIYL